MNSRRGAGATRVVAHSDATFADGFINKPYTQETLAQCLDAVLVKGGKFLNAGTLHDADDPGH